MMDSHVGKEFLVGRRKCRLAQLGIRIFGDFTNPVEAPAAKTHHLSGAIYQIRQESRTAYFIGKLNSASQKRIRE